jgi:hypothetical protein
MPASSDNHVRPPAAIRDMAVYTGHVVSPKDLSLVTHPNIKVRIFMTESICDGYTPGSGPVVRLDYRDGPTRSLRGQVLTAWAAGLLTWAQTTTAT